MFERVFYFDLELSASLEKGWKSDALTDVRELVDTENKRCASGRGKGNMFGSICS